MTTILERAFREGRIIRGKWSDTDAKGRQLLCLLTALAGDPHVRPETCPAHLCSPWIAYLLPWIDDAGTAERWPGFIERCVQLAPWWGQMTPQQSRHLDLFTRKVSLLEARQFVGESTKDIDDVLALISRAMSGDEPLHGDWTKARAASSAAATRASAAAHEAAWAAWAAHEAGRVSSAAAAASASAASAAGAAAASAGARAAGVGAAGAASASDVRVADRMIDAILTEMERVRAGGVIHTRSKP